MSGGVLAMLVGLFAVPVALLWAGHRLRRRSPRSRAAFWGGLGGYALGSCAALAAGMLPPAEWDGGDTVRGLMGFWLPLLLPAAGGVIGAARGATRDRA